MATPSRYAAMDCYEILGIPQDATLKDINSAYKRLALMHHPDKTGGDDAAIEFQRIQQAIEILRDPPRRKEHDERLGHGRSRRRRPATEEEKLFGSSDYTGWRPSNVSRSDYNRRDRYMFSYSNSVHMNPDSQESQEELARCARAREEEREKEKETIRRAADEILAENRARARARDEEVLASLRRNENTWSSLNPEIEPFQASGYEARYDGSVPVWWAGAGPELNESAGFEADTEAGNDFAGEAEVEAGVDGTEFGIDSDVNIDADINIVLDAEENNEVNTEPETEPQVEVELKFVPEFDTSFKINSKVNVKADTTAHIDAGVNAIPDAEYEVEPSINLELEPDYHAEFDIKTIIADAKAKANKGIGPGLDTIPESEEQPKADTEADRETNADGDTAAEEHATGFWATLSTSPKLFGATTEYMTASQGTFSTPTSNNYMMSGALFQGRSEPQVDAAAISTENADNESVESIYYDFSDAAVSQSNQTENDNSIDISINDVFDTPSGKKSSPTLYYDFKFNDTNIYPHLAPFVPYFAAKLAHNSGWYTRDDFHIELKGMVMETYCGWLETVRVTIPGAAFSLKTELDPQQTCRHLGYWEKELGHERCEMCDLWKPIYTLVCPGCGLKRCVGCKFEHV
ncbi:hypothetical protein BDW59DRAFT_99875 [Aspergillus cavernicola]|uniref:J domain-containing protein n=1 Tax=Aspergillus cavernicola TaxID=176166 RepID=A0ABR4I5Y9_9EURO